MKTVSISNLKARLSACLDIVRDGHEVLVTDSGRVIAKLVPVAGGQADAGRRDLLLRSGRLRPPTGRLPADFWKRHHPVDAKGRSLAALLGERDAGG